EAARLRTTSNGFSRYTDELVRFAFEPRQGTGGQPGDLWRFNIGYCTACYRESRGDCHGARPGRSYRDPHGSCAAERSDEVDAARRSRARAENAVDFEQGRGVGH